LPFNRPNHSKPNKHETQKPERHDSKGSHNETAATTWWWAKSNNNNNHDDDSDDDMRVATRERRRSAATWINTLRGAAPFVPHRLEHLVRVCDSGKLAAHWPLLRPQPHNAH
jgi:hypothetical protein